MVRALIKLVIFGLLVHAVWQVGPAYWNYYKFKDRVNETALFAGSRSEQDVVDRVMELAAKDDLPVNREAVRVRKDSSHTAIEVTYTQELQILPTFSYPWEFRVSVDAPAVRPAK